MPPSPARTRAPLHCTLCALVLLAVPQQPWAGQAQAGVRVTATVQESASVRVLQQPARLVITQDDVRRGWLAAPAATLLALRCNMPRGVDLQVAFDTSLVAAATVTGLPQPAQLAGDGGVLRLAGPHLRETVFELRWQLRLAPGARAGTYAWPVALQVEPF